MSLLRDISHSEPLLILLFILIFIIIYQKIMMLNLSRQPRCNDMTSGCRMGQVISTFRNGAIHFLSFGNDPCKIFLKLS